MTTPKDSPTPEQLKPSPEPLKLNAYYYCFGPTGCFEIDLILSAVARAGKAFHHTDSWSDDCPPYDERFKGRCPIDWIQNAAIDAAKAFKSRAEPDAKAAEWGAQQRGAVVPIEVAEEMRYLAGFALPSAEPNSVSRERYMGFCAAIAAAKENGNG